MEKTDQLEAYCDSDFAGDQETRSRIRHILCWRSYKLVL